MSNFYYLVLSYPYSLLSNARPSFDAKRLIGRKINDAEVQSDMKHWPFKVVAKSGDKPSVQVEYRGEIKELYPRRGEFFLLTMLKINING